MQHAAFRHVTWRAALDHPAITPVQLPRLSRMRGTRIAIRPRLALRERSREYWRQPGGAQQRPDHTSHRGAGSESLDVCSVVGFRCRTSCCGALASSSLRLRRRRVAATVWRAAAVIDRIIDAEFIFRPVERQADRAGSFHVTHNSRYCVQVRTWMQFNRFEATPRGLGHETRSA